MRKNLIFLKRGTREKKYKDKVKEKRKGERERERERPQKSSFKSNIIYP
jgi:hypothetical protein